MTGRDSASSADVATAPTGLDRSAQRWHRIRIGAGIAYAAVLAAVVIATGVPISRLVIAIIIVVGLGITRLGRGWRALGQVILDWLPFTLVLIAYDKTRAFADAVGVPLHESDVVGWERGLFGGDIPTVVLQQQWYDPAHVHWYDAAFTLIYTTHFLATPVLAAVLWVRERAAWVRFISRVVVLSVAGLVTYVVFPEAPPWLAAQDGVIAEPIARLSARGWIWLHAGNLQATLDHAQQAGSNPVAAMPSLHVAFASIVALFIATRLSSWWRWLLALYPVAMGLTLVYTGEHYVVDLIAGVAYAVAVHLLMNVWERRRAAKKTAVGATPARRPGDDLVAATELGADPAPSAPRAP